MRLKERDKLILKVIEKMRFLDRATIRKLCDFSDDTYCRKRLIVLCDNGYIQYEKIPASVKKYYFLTGKGMNVLYPVEKRVNKNGKEYNKYKKIPRFSLTKANHEITVANILAYLLKCNPTLTVDDIKSEREMQKLTPEQKIFLRHYCDLFCETYHIKVEVELSIKMKKIVADNISLNGDECVQIWIAGTTAVYNQLMKLAEEMPYFFIKIIRLEELENEDLNFEKLYNELLEFNTKIERKTKQLSIDNV